ncbi:MAG TPA: zinc ribbon domain-containing protein [Thermoleophilaceae bacterium]|nr:zinc ribbon domain-containing protein [Thermoleophilaceae bacterium]
MPPSAIFGIENDSLSIVVGLLILFLAALWLALAFYTYTDARRRVADPMLVGTATVAALIFPFIGTIVYMIVRPPEFLEDVHERELEIQAAEARLAQLQGETCPYCEFHVERDFLRCPSCLRRLKEPCRSCGKPLGPRWKICPFCEAEVSSAQGRARGRPSGRAPTGRSRQGPAPTRGAGNAAPSGEGAPAGGAAVPPAR